MLTTLADVPPVPTPLPIERISKSVARAAELTLAINRVIKADDGQKRDEVTFVDVVLWSRLAEIAQQYLKKGRSAFIGADLRIIQELLGHSDHWRAWLISPTL